MRTLTIIGTRPEAIKMAPVIHALQSRQDVESIVCVTGQHREMLDPVLTLFGIRPDHDLDLMQSGQSLNELLARVIDRLDLVIEQSRPDWILVHGDTTTAMGASLAAFGRGIPIAHVEAGLRTHDLERPWPEELNRRVADLVGGLLFAPTPGAKVNLLRESVRGRIVVTGNTGVDALETCAAVLSHDVALRRSIDEGLPSLDPGRRLLLVTGHRRENLGKGLDGVCEALARLDARGDLEIVYPLHLNPGVHGPVRAALGGRPHIHLPPHQGYLAFIRLMQRATLVLTDSGGVQEEAPWLGVPVLITRDCTERPEGADVGAARLVGSDPGVIEREVSRLLDDPQAHSAAALNGAIYGDGHAAVRIVKSLMGEPVEEWRPQTAWAGGKAVAAPPRLQA